ncbi:MAG: AAA family ATPase [Rubrobacter sp.]
MILARLYLENFKQFRSPLDLQPPEGAIGVVGPNGSGKTTLFEAILWAFFGAKAGGSRFSNDSIPWSGGSVAEKSLAEVTLDVGGASYTVSRSLHRGKATAQVRDESGGEITSGPNDVSNWVQGKLLEMDRVAFDATFFARQKELAFFAGVEGVKRQREVARILGIDQVEKAQKLLREDKNGLASEVRAMEQILSGTDFDLLEADLAERTKLHEALKQTLSERTTALGSRTESLEKARAEENRLEKLYRDHNRLATELGGATAARDRSLERVADLESRLRRLDEDEKRVAEIEPEIQGLAGVEAEIGKLEDARRREERLKSARKEFNRLRREAHDAAMKAADLLEELPASPELLPGWPGISEPGGDELAQARRAAKVLEQAEAAYERAAAQLEALKREKERHGELSALNARLENAAKHIEEVSAETERLDAQMKRLTGGVSLGERLTKLRTRRDELGGDSAQRKGRAGANESEAKKLAKAREMIESSDEYARCPTCQRGYSEDEHAEVIASIRRQEEELSRRAEEAREEGRRLDAEAKKALDEISATEKTRSEVQELASARTVATTRHQSYREKRDELAAEAEELHDELAGRETPTPQRMEEAERRTAHLRTLRDARPGLLGLLASNERSGAAAQEKHEEIEELSGGEPYDPERYASLTASRAQLQTLAGRLEALKSGLKLRPETEARLIEERASREESTAQVAKLESGIKELGFKESAYAEARRMAVEEEHLRDEAREGKTTAERALGEVESRMESLRKELERNAGQRRLADEKSVEVASLGSMDGLFTEFYRELTARVRPRLQREASELITTLTDGRYRQMEFDENYGVKLYDGVSDAYEISRFSGGETDIVSLAARVALSKMISGKSSGSSLGFIVLDEVFGALDASRRNNVLLALERLKRTFGQIFIISHVADVQESPLLDEMWFIEEDEEGCSSVRIEQGDPQIGRIEALGLQD